MKSFVLPNNLYRKVVDGLAYKLFCSGVLANHRKVRTEKEFIESTAVKQSRLFYRKLARKAIDFARDDGPMAQCVLCGCTDAEACPEGCSWIVVNRFQGKGVCSSCAKAGLYER